MLCTIQDGAHHVCPPAKKAELHHTEAVLLSGCSFSLPNDDLQYCTLAFYHQQLYRTDNYDTEGAARHAI